MNLSSLGTDDDKSKSQLVKRMASGLSGPKQPTGDWEVFLGMWERANLVRAFFWRERVDDERLLLIHFLPRLRRFFAVDFCFGALNVSEDVIVEVGVPEIGLGQLPRNFSRRCLESVANSRAPVIWNDAGIKLGFRTTVIVPLRAPSGASFGFLLLGQSRSRSYSAVELFVLQALAGELSWVVRDLAARKAHHHKLAAVSHSIKNALQVILGKAAMMRQQLKDVSSGSDNHIEDVEEAVAMILNRLRALPESDAPESSAGASPTDLSSALAESLASCRRAARERGVTLEVAYAPDAARRAPEISERAKGFLTALVDTTTSIARGETVRLAVQHRDRALELIVQGIGSNRVADKLKSLFGEGASRSEGARDERTVALAQMCEYLDDVGGDVYLKGRPGEAAEFMVRLPVESSAQGARLSEKNDVDTKDLA